MRPFSSPTTHLSDARATSLDVAFLDEQGLDGATLLALLISRTLPQRQITRAVEALLTAFGSVVAMVAADPPELAQVASLGAITITDVKLLGRLNVRLARAEVCHRSILSSWRP